MQIHFDSEESLRSFVRAALDLYENDIDTGTEPHIAAARAENHVLAAVMSLDFGETLH